MKFKVGDKVRCLKTCAGFYEKGEVFEVEKLHTVGGINIGICIRDTSAWDCSSWFELVDDKESLSKSLKIIQDGFDELEKMKLTDSIDFCYKNQWGDGAFSTWRILTPEDFSVYKFRLKEINPSFEMIVKTLYESFKLTIKDRKITVGCKEFDAKDLKNQLDQIVNKRFTSTPDFSCVMNGVAYGKHTVPYDEVKKVLAKLIEAGY